MAITFQTLQQQTYILVDQAKKMDSQAISEQQRASFSATIKEVLDKVDALPGKGGVNDPTAFQNFPNVRQSLMGLYFLYNPYPVTVYYQGKRENVPMCNIQTIKDLKEASSTAFNIPVQSIVRFVFPPNVQTIFPDNIRLESVWSPSQHRNAHLLAKKE